MTHQFFAIFTMKHDLPSFALLIDADNVRQESISPILEEITRHARLTVRRIYGDFTTSNLAGWKIKLAEHAIQPIQQYRNTVGKNASDSALIIDAMDLLHSHRFEGFCLVSSDSDFTRLATRIREDGLVVYGFGEKKAPKAFVNACDRYIYVENLLGTPDIAVTETTPEKHISAPVPALELPVAAEPAPASARLPPLANAQSPVPTVTIDFKPPALATNLLMRAHTNVADDLGWAMLGQMSSYIHANHPDFDPRTYGCAKFIDLVNRTTAFEVVQRPYKNGQVHYCRPAGSKRPSEAHISAQPKPNSKAASKLAEAVIQATGESGWAAVGAIGQRLKASGYQLKGSGYSTLTKALNGSGLFEMKGSGAARYFRLQR